MATGTETFHLRDDRSLPASRCGLCNLRSQHADRYSNDLRPTWLSQIGCTAAESKIVHIVETSENAQLGWDHAIFLDHGTRMALLMFHENGGRLIPEPSRRECDAVRMHNWIERTRSDEERTSKKKYLTKSMAEVKRCPNEQEVERIIPRVKFAQYTGLSKLSLVLEYILAKLATRTYDEMMTRESTYDGWYQQLRRETVDLAKEL